uniref:Uncharacterized protein n=1 Tax=Gopherus agassizii TaxID=38772 RepID=A0A452I3Q9_9SAUR
ISQLEEQLSLELAEKRGLMEELAQERGEGAGSSVCEGGISVPAQGQGTEMAASSQWGVLASPLASPLSLGWGHRKCTAVWGEGESAHADTILELEKTRDMLILQHRINRDYQAELEGVMVQAEQEKRGHEEKQQKMVQLLDLRSTRIRQLEGKSRASPTCPLEQFLPLPHS